MYVFFVWLLSLDMMQLCVAEIHLFSLLHDFPLYAILQFIYPSAVDRNVGSSAFWN